MENADITATLVASKKHPMSHLIEAPKLLIKIMGEGYGFLKFNIRLKNYSKFI